MIGQQPAIVNQGEDRVRGWRILGIAPRLEIDNRGAGYRTQSAQPP